MPNKSSLRPAIATLLRLADEGLGDARVLLQRGRLRGGCSLSASAVDYLVQAVGVAERGRSGAPAMRRADDLDPGNPFRSRMQAMQASNAPTQPAADGALPASPDRPSAQRALDAAVALLDELVALFSVTLQSDEPAGRTDLVPATPKPPMPEPAADPQQEVPRSPPVSRPAIHVAAPPVASSSTAFWALIDRWRIGDLDALGLLGHPGGLTRKGTRPRFRLSADEAAALGRLREMDDALSVLDLDPRRWLQQPVEVAPFRGRTPLDLLQNEQADGAEAVHRYVVRLGMRLSLGGPG